MLEPITGRNGLSRAAEDVVRLLKNDSLSAGRGITLHYWKAKSYKKHWLEFGLAAAGGRSERVVQINMPFEGIREGFTGQIATDEAGRRWLLHLGHLMAKPRPITRPTFDQLFDLGTERVSLDLGGTVRDYYKVACLDSPEFLDSVEAYVKACARVRRTWEDRHGSDNGTRPTDHGMFEGKGRRQFIVPPRDPLEVDTFHDLVVAALANRLKALGVIPSDDRRMRRGPDLFFGTPDTTAGLFEVKTSTEPYSIYTALGQLFFYRQLLGEGHRILVAVLPGAPSRIDADVLSSLGVKVLRYSVSGDDVEFLDDLEAMLV